MFQNMFKPSECSGFAVLIRPTIVYNRASTGVQQSVQNRNNVFPRFRFRLYRQPEHDVTMALPNLIIIAMETPFN